MTKGPAGWRGLSLYLFRSFDIGDDKSLKLIYCIGFVRLLLENLNQVEHCGLLCSEGLLLAEPFRIVYFILL